VSPTTPLGPLLHSYFLDHLIAVKGLRPGSVRSYRDTIRLLLLFIAADKRCKLTRLQLGDLTFERVLAFLRDLEQGRGNSISTRNQRLAAVRSLFEYIATRSPEMLAVCQQVAAIPAKRVPPPETRFLERDEAQRLLAGLPSRGRLALRDRALVLFLYNTGARVQEAADLRAGHLDLGEHPTVRLHGKGDKWRTCPLWQQTARTLEQLLQSQPQPPTPVHRPQPTAHPLRDLQDRPPARRRSRRLQNRPPSQPAHLPAHRRGAPTGSGRRGQRDPRLARARRPHHHQPIRRDQHQSQTASAAPHRTARYYRGTPHQPNLADRREAAELARLALKVMWPKSTPPSGLPP
jgi:integrase